MTDIGSDLGTVLISGFPMLGKKKKRKCCINGIYLINLVKT